MRVFAIIFSVLSVAACQSSAPSSGVVGDQSTAERAVNPQIAKIIEQKRNAEVPGVFPVLADMPSSLPEKYSATEIESFQNNLVDSRRSLLAGLSADMAILNADRKIGAALYESGARIEVSLKEAAAVLQQRILQDQARMAKNKAVPVPALGGLPPKEQR